MGSGSTYFLLDDGTVWSVGSAASLGDGTTSARSTPAQIPGLTGVTQIEAGANGSAYALLSSGQVRSWGANAVGQLGDGTTTARTTPVVVLAPGGGGPLTGIVEIVGGSVHALARTSTGQVYAWGSNTVGQLGDGTTTARSLPGLVPGLSGITSIAAGFTSSFAVLSTAEARVWGASGTTYSTSQLSPIVLLGAGGAGALTGIRRIAGGYATSYALLTSGQLRAWGANAQGQLGNNSTTNSLTPVTVQGVGGGGALSGVAQVTGGYVSGQALLSSSQVVTWGSSNDGQQGNGSTSGSRLVPGGYTLPTGTTAKAIGVVSNGAFPESHFAILNG